MLVNFVKVKMTYFFLPFFLKLQYIDKETRNQIRYFKRKYTFTSKNVVDQRISFVFFLEKFSGYLSESCDCFYIEKWLLKYLTTYTI